MLTKSSLWATATPTAAKLPISDEDGKLAVGWVRYNYAPTVTVAADTLLDDTHAIVLVSAAATISLPTAVGIAGRLYNVVRTGTGAVTIQPDGVETISGDTPLVLTSQWDSVVFVSDGTNWVLRDTALGSGAGAGISTATVALDFGDEGTVALGEVTHDSISAMSVITATIVGENAEEAVILGMTAGIIAQSAGTCTVIGGCANGASGTFNVNLHIA